MSANSKTYGERLDKACELLIARDYETAVPFCDQLRTEFPDRGESYYLLGIISEILGDRGKAVRFMEEGFKLEPSAQEFAHALAVLSAMSGNLNDMNYYVKLTLVLEPSEFLSDIELDTYFADLNTILKRVSVPVELFDARMQFHQRQYKGASR